VSLKSSKKNPLKVAETLFIPANTGGPPLQGQCPPHKAFHYGPGWNQGIPEFGISGVYILKDSATGKVYVGSSCDIKRRCHELEIDIENHRFTVGRNFPSWNTIEVSYFVVIVPHPDILRIMDFHKQTILDYARYWYGNYNVINVINAMSPTIYDEIMQSGMVIICPSG